jgi:hypothetical protein
VWNTPEDGDRNAAETSVSQRTDLEGEYTASVLHLPSFVRVGFKTANVVHKITANTIISFCLFIYLFIYLFMICLTTFSIFVTIRGGLISLWLYKKQQATGLEI